jgi:cellulose synthase/poly-beta-1,6-N-acetylglucosamine synthase-like glycosyltransferase
VIIFIIAEALLLIYFAYVASYTLIFSVAGLFYREREFQKVKKNFRFAVFIPAYKEDGVILDVAKRALDQHYPSSFFDVVVIADSLQPETVLLLRSLPIKLIEVSFESSTKVKSLNYALKSLDDHYDCAVILDADNVMYPDFLEKMNEAHQSGLSVIQGQRVPKNTDNSLSLLDGLSEAINNHVYRQGTVALGLSASINGSGVSFDFKRLKKLLLEMESVGGFDRELELMLLAEGTKVYYFKSAKVLDEKVHKTEVFENQRKRWISSQYHYLAKYFQKGLIALTKGNFTYFNSAILRNVQLPRLINLGLLGFMTVILFFIQNDLHFSYWYWPCLLMVMIFSLFISIPADYYDRNLLKAIGKIPGLFIRMVLLLFKLKGANKKFIHTPHYSVDVKIDNAKK